MSTSSHPDLLAQINPQPLTTAHVRDIALLHFKQLPWSFNGQFGEEHIFDLYAALSRSSHFFGYVFYAEGNLLGFVTATTDYVEARHLLSGVYARKLSKVFRVFAKHPRFLITALESKYVVPLVFKYQGARAEWLTFVTDTSHAYLSPLVALRLIQVMNEHMTKAGVRVYVAQGYKNNPKAMRYYEKLRWRVVASLLMHNVYCWTTS